MATSLKITGTPIKEPKKKKEVVELLFKGTMSERVPKVLKSSVESLFIVNVSTSQWSKIAKDVKNDSVFTIEGDLMASLTQGGRPYISVACRHISLKEPKDVKENIEEEKPKAEKQAEKNKYENLNKFREDVADQLIDINLDDVILTEEVHTTNNRKRIILEGIFNEDNTLKLWCLIVRKLDGGNYSLVSGFKSYATCKVYDIKTVKAYVTDLNHDEFEKKIEGYLEEKQKEEEERKRIEKEQKEEEKRREEEEKLKEEEQKKEEERQKKKEKYDKALKNKKVKGKK